MRRILLSALLASALYGPAHAGPLQISPEENPSGLRVDAEQASAAGLAGARRYAQTPQSGLGNGFIEFLFGGARQPSFPRAYQPASPDYAPGTMSPSSAMRGEPAQSYVPTAFGDMAHPQVDPKYDRQIVVYDGDQEPGTVVIDTPHKFLYLVAEGGKALRYGIGVGRPGFTWSGVKAISAKREWPDWRPPDDMLRRRPDLPHYMAGGPENPLGARALYLGSSLYRIHGSNEPWTIGTQVSSGCIRMRNDDVTDLYNRVKVGTKVIVI